jgi:hypothetical protein
LLIELLDALLVLLARVFLLAYFSIQALDFGFVGRSASYQLFAFAESFVP